MPEAPEARPVCYYNKLFQYHMFIYIYVIKVSIIVLKALYVNIDYLISNS